MPGASMARHLAALLAAAWLTLAGASCTMGRATAATPHDRVSDIRARGVFRCGVWPEVNGFAAERPGVGLVGFDIDFCRAIAGAVLGDGTRVQFVRVANAGEFLAQHDVDVAIRRLSRTPAREASGQWLFGPVTFHDGQAFLVPRSQGIASVAQLAGQRVCVLDRERHPRIVRDHFRQRGQTVSLVLVEDDAQAGAALRGHRCLAYSADRSWLAAAAASADLGNGSADFDLLPELISSEPLAPLMRAGDRTLAQIVACTARVLLAAEEDGMRAGDLSHSPGTVGAVAPPRAAPADTCAMVVGEAGLRAAVSAAGNYGEIYERNLGAASGLRLERGPNGLQRDGGLMSASAIIIPPAAPTRPDP